MSTVYGIIYCDTGVWKLHETFWDNVSLAVSHIQEVRMKVQKEHQLKKVWDQGLPSAMIVEIGSSALSSITDFSSETKDDSDQNKEEALTETEIKGAGTAAQFDRSSDLS
jgi:hypothetical protein